MIRLLGVLAGFSVVLHLAVAAPVPTHLFPKDPPLAFPTRVGTTWVYEGTSGKQTLVISEVKEKDGAKLVTTVWVSEDGKRTPNMVQLINETGVYIVSEDGEKHKEPWLFVKLPYREGQTWEPKVGPSTLGKMTAGPIERIRVPAGEFTAARIDWEISFGNGKTQKVTYWHAHRVGLVRLDEQMKLKSFTPGKD